MAASQVREWTGLQQFPLATQAALHGLLGKLRQEGVNFAERGHSDRTGAWEKWRWQKLNCQFLLGERVTGVSAFQSETMRPIQCSRSRAGFTLHVIDTPGLVEGGLVNDQALAIIQRFLLNKTIDVMFYMDRLDGYRVDNLDKQIIRAITGSFGPQIWHIGMIVLSHAQLSPPDGLNYAEFVSKRSAALQGLIRQEAGFKKIEKEVPVVLVENSGRCNTNIGGEKILPDGSVWLPNLVEHMIEVVTGDGKSILIDKKLIDGPNANHRGKIWIPLVLLAQFFLILRPIRKAIERDMEEERQHRPRWETRAQEYHSLALLEEEHADQHAINDALQQDDYNLGVNQSNDYDDDDDDY